LKKALERLVPRDIVYRQKQGFSIPLARWMMGRMGDEFERDACVPGGLADCGLFNMATVNRMLSEHRQKLATIADFVAIVDVPSLSGLRPCFTTANLEPRLGEQMGAYQKTTTVLLSADIDCAGSTAMPASLASLLRPFRC
jgi:hypothetical protein